MWWGMESCFQTVDSAENNGMRLNVCMWGRKVCDDLASKRDTESVSSERSHKEPRWLARAFKRRNHRITRLTSRYLELRCVNLVTLYLQKTSKIQEKPYIQQFYSFKPLLTIGVLNNSDSKSQDIINVLLCLDKQCWFYMQIMQQYRIYEVINKHNPIVTYFLICWPFAKIWRKGLALSCLHCLGKMLSYFGKIHLNGDSILKYKETTLLL